MFRCISPWVMPTTHLAHSLTLNLVKFCPNTSDSETASEIIYFRSAIALEVRRRGKRAKILETESRFWRYYCHYIVESLSLFVASPYVGNISHRRRLAVTRLCVLITYVRYQRTLCGELNLHFSVRHSTRRVRCFARNQKFSRGPDGKCPGKMRDFQRGK